jgi:excisionase family DNA binding protein
MKTIYKQTTQKDQQAAEACVPYLKKAITKKDISPENIEITVKDSGETIQVPKKAYLLFIEIIEQMAQGKSVHLLPGDSELTTQQAADILNVSRPYVVKLLEEGKIPFKKTGSHRRVRLADLMNYKKQFDDKRRKHLDNLTRISQELNLGY